MTGSNVINRKVLKGLKNTLAAVEKPLFSPLSQQTAKLQTEQTLAQRALRHPQRSRWTLDLLQVACSAFIRVKSRGALKHVLKSLGISYQRARTYFRSPDVDYMTKLTYLRHLISVHRAEQAVLLFMDELTYYNHASTAPEHCIQKQQPKAGLAIGGERTWRVIGALDIFSGGFIAEQRKAVRVPTFVGFLRDIAQKYPQAKTIYLVLDNWPVHFHPDVLDALQEQTCPYPFLVPKNWKSIKPSGKYKNENLPIQLVPLPTYASWLNPVEKIWRWLKQQVIHNHSFANNFKELIRRVEYFLDGIASPSQKTLSATGLLNPKGIFADQLTQAGILIPQKTC